MKHAHPGRGFKYWIFVTILACGAYALSFGVFVSEWLSAGAGLIVLAIGWIITGVSQDSTQESIQALKDKNFELSQTISVQREEMKTLEAKPTNHKQIT